MFAENYGRKDLSPLQEARAYQAMLELTDGKGRKVFTQRSLAKRLGVGQAKISDDTGIFKLPERVVTMLEQGEPTVTEAVLLVRLAKYPDRVEAALADYRRQTHKDMDLAVRSQQADLEREERVEQVRHDLKAAGVAWPRTTGVSAVASGSATATTSCTRRSRTTPASRATPPWSPITATSPTSAPSPTGTSRRRSPPPRPPRRGADGRRDAQPTVAEPTPATGTTAEADRTPKPRRRWPWCRRRPSRPRRSWRPGGAWRRLGRPPSGSAKSASGSPGSGPSSWKRPTRRAPRRCRRCWAAGSPGRRRPGCGLVPGTPGVPGLPVRRRLRPRRPAPGRDDRRAPPRRSRRCWPWPARTTTACSGWPSRSSPSTSRSCWASPTSPTHQRRRRPLLRLPHQGRGLQALGVRAGRTRRQRRRGRRGPAGGGGYWRWPSLSFAGHGRPASVGRSPFCRALPVIPPESARWPSSDRCGEPPAGVQWRRRRDRPVLIVVCLACALPA